MKVVHVIKKIEEIDLDVRELRKLEKSVKQNKSFTTPIYMTIEKQINILLGERIKLLELKIENPPENLAKDIGIEKKVETKPLLSPTGEQKKSKKKKTKKAEPIKDDFDDEDDELKMLTQDDIDSKFDTIQKKEKKKTTTAKKASKNNEEEEIDPSDDSVKLLDVALEKGSLNTKEQEKEKKVRFFRDNFPVD